MSKYKTIETQFKTLASLLAALADLGYSKEQIQVAPNPKVPTLKMYGYQDDVRPEKASIRIDRHVIGSASNDVGFAWNGNSYVAMVSEFDMTASGPMRMNTERQAKLKQRYALHETKRVAKIKGYTVQETQMADGTLRLSLTHR